MKTLIIFYSYSGKTKAIAQELAIKESAELEEVKDRKCPHKLKAYTSGLLAAIRGRSWPIQPLSAEVAKYDRLVLLSPVWADNPPPAFNSVLGLLPEGKTVAVKMISASGKSNCKERLEAAIRAKGGIWESFEDVKA
ncbi:MAG: hypothetical protein FWB97_02445 [Oscillospiraceae bacterium]|nr:hypothetical protein [Oscillospiraceae bacterium]